MGMTNERRFRLGDLVRERDGRHTGKVVALRGGLSESRNDAVEVRVKWQETGWLSDHDHGDLELVEARKESKASATVRPRPKTMALSPRAELEMAARSWVGTDDLKRIINGDNPKPKKRRTPNESHIPKVGR
jgi:hypothetical protein